MSCSLLNLRQHLPAVGVLKSLTSLPQSLRDDVACLPLIIGYKIVRGWAPVCFWKTVKICSQEESSEIILIILVHIRLI